MAKDVGIKLKITRKPKPTLKDTAVDEVTKSFSLGKITKQQEGGNDETED